MTPSNVVPVPKRVACGTSNIFHRGDGPRIAVIAPVHCSSYLVKISLREGARKLEMAKKRIGDPELQFVVGTSCVSILIDTTRI